jgi:hypothetical protein
VLREADKNIAVNRACPFLVFFDPRACALP